MPDNDAQSRGNTSETHGETRNLPVHVPRASEAGRGGRKGFFARLLRSLRGKKKGSVRAHLEAMLDKGADGAAGFSPEESTMLKNILGMSARRIEDVMIPRANIVAVQQDIALGELVKVFEGAAHSRLVVYNDTLDDPVGMVHIRDVIAFMARRAATNPAPKRSRKKASSAGLDFTAVDLSMSLAATKIIRTILFVPPSMSTLDLLAKMQATRIHLALVVDEYGGTDGIVSLEDLVEQIVGKIEDEHDEEAEHSVVRQPDGSFVADARANLEDVTKTVGVEFDVGEAGKAVDTIGGYLMAQVGRLPVRGELIPGPGPFEIEVLDADPRRIKKLKIYLSTHRLADRDRDPRRRDGTDTRTASASPPPAPPDSASRP